MHVQLIHLQGNYPPIGLGYLASTLEAEDIDVGILDFGGLGYSTTQLYSNVKRELSKTKPDLLGITCLTTQAHLALDVARLAKDVNTHCYTVLGGPHPSAAPFDVAQNPNVDFVVVGEGERTLLSLVQTLSISGKLSEVNGLVYKSGDNIITTQPRKPIEKLDELPFPAYHLFPERKLNLVVDAHGLNTRGKYMEVFTSRGCPYQCVYCHKMFGKRFRGRSAENVLKEIALLYEEYGIREIHFEDDCFNFDVNRAKKILDLLIASGMDLSIRFPNGLRADYVDEELISKMKRAGVYQISVGVETASPRIMKMIRKVLNLKKVEETVELALKYGLTIRGFFMIGFPGETKKEIMQTIEYAKNLDIHFASFSIVTPFPGTELYEIAADGGYIKDRDYSKYFFANASIETDELLGKSWKRSKEELRTSFIIILEEKKFCYQMRSIQNLSFLI